MELFKYCRREHMLALKDTGAVRVGSLSDFRKTDRYGELVSDDYEGSKKLAGTISNLNSENVHQYPGLKGLISIEGGGSVGLLTVTDFVHSVPDLLIFSAAKEYSEAAHRLWADSEGYDSCYRINSPRLFFRAITAALGDQYEFLGFAEVHYADEIDIATPQAGIHPALVKRHTGYADQAEVRALWAPRNTANVEPVILGRSRAFLYVAEHRTIPIARGAVAV